MTFKLELGDEAAVHSDQVAKFVKTQQVLRETHLGYTLHVSPYILSMFFEVDSVNCWIKPTSQEAKLLRGTSGASLSQTFFEDLGAKRRHQWHHFKQKIKQGSVQIFGRHLPIAKHHARKTGPNLGYFDSNS